LILLRLKQNQEGESLDRTFIHVLRGNASSIREAAKREAAAAER